MKSPYQFILYSVKNFVATVTLNRPEIHNAFNDVMIEELKDVFQRIAKDERVRVVVLTGSGKSFCAGADLNWLRRVKDYTYRDNLEEAQRLADLFYQIYKLPKPTIARVNGSAIGGGMGLMAACDIAVAVENAEFGHGEVKLGLAPSVISPYLLKRMGEGPCRELFLTGERFSAQKALQYGLINQVVSPAKLDQAVEEKVKQLLSSGPKAVAICKELLQKVPQISLEEAKAYTTRMIASLRMSEEGQEGMAAFLEKRRPNWVVENGDDNQTS